MCFTTSLWSRGCRLRVSDGLFVSPWVKLRCLPLSVALISSSPLLCVRFGAACWSGLFVGSADFGSGGGGSSFTWCWGFALLLEEVVRLGSGDAAPSLHRLRGRARLSKLSAIKLLWFSVVLSFVRSWLRPCPSSDLEGSP